MSVHTDNLAQSTLMRLIEMRTSEVNYLWLDLCRKSGRDDLTPYLAMISENIDDLKRALVRGREDGGLYDTQPIDVRDGDNGGAD